jgi:hypothetical protein
MHFDIFTTAQEIQVVEFPTERTVCTIMYNCFNTFIPRHDLTMFDSVVLRSEFCATTDHFKGAHN